MKHHEHNHGFGTGQGAGRGEGGFCVCSQCGYSEPHRAGIPCRTLYCPECNLPLVRSETSGNKMKASSTDISSSENLKNDNLKKKERKIAFPRVNAEKCTGCQQCIDICPRGAIILKNGKAFVETENCSNCLVCMRICPENAFILE